MARSKKKSAGTIQAQAPLPKLVQATDFSCWENLDPGTFLQDDAANPARMLAVKIIMDRLRLLTSVAQPTVLEIGCGTGIDYDNFFQHYHTSGKILYLGLDPAKNFIRALKAKHGGTTAPFSVGDFSTLRRSRKEYDATYARAVFEHQPELDSTLSALLSRTKHICVVNWYLPIGDEDIPFFAKEQGVFYNKWSKDHIAQVVSSCGFTIEEHLPADSPTGVPILPNAVYALHRKH